MSLATRCTACGTAFRVVQDQLKVSEGWVRCGRCGEVFNAVAGLFDLERESPERWQAQSIEPPSSPGTGAVTEATDRQDNVALAAQAQRAVPADGPTRASDFGESDPDIGVSIPNGPMQRAAHQLTARLPGSEVPAPEP